MVKSLPAMQRTWVRPLSREEPLEAGMTTHYSILTWRIPWTDWWATVHGVTVGHNRATNTSTFQAGGREVEGCWGRRRGGGYDDEGPLMDIEGNDNMGGVT